MKQVILITAMILFAGVANADDMPLLKLDASPHTKLRPVGLTDVRLTDGFWAEQYQQAAKVSLRKLWNLAADEDEGHVITNFAIAGGSAEGEFAGTDWQDAWLYKWIESAASFYAISGDPWIAERMDEAVALAEAAQEDDGYISTQITVTGRPRFTDPRQHEVYVMGHLLTAACVHHRVTGKDSLLNVAIRCADFLCETLGVSVPPGYAHNPSAVMGMVELYRETGEEKYLDCAKMIVDRRGEAPKPGGVFYQEPGVLGTDLFQDRTPVRKSWEVVGHNVFFTYLYAGATDIYLENGDETLWSPLDRLWKDLTERKICINGGVSPMGHGLSLGKDGVVEAVGAPYHLPCADCYNETCGQIGNMMWNYRMLCARPDAKYADIMETELYNGFLAGVSLEGDSWFYRNSLRRYDIDHDAAGHNNLAERVVPGRKRICCPTNLLRTVAQVQTYLYSVSPEGLWIHHYTGNELNTKLPSGETVSLAMKTDYPWDGRVTITVKEAPADPLLIKFRVPGWAEGCSVTVNGKTLPQEPKPGSYGGVRNMWKSGDTIELNLPMPGRLMYAHPKAEQLRNQVAVMRGPMLYCLESKDFSDEVDLNNVYLPSDVQVSAEAADNFPFGVHTLSLQGLYRSEASWDGTLYRQVKPEPMTGLPLRMIPYFTWANRGPAAMTAWLPVVWKE